MCEYLEVSREDLLNLYDWKEHMRTIEIDNKLPSNIRFNIMEDESTNIDCYWQATYKEYDMYISETWDSVDDKIKFFCVEI